MSLTTGGLSTWGLLARGLGSGVGGSSTPSPGPGSATGGTWFVPASGGGGGGSGASGGPVAGLLTRGLGSGGGGLTGGLGRSYGPSTGSAAPGAGTYVQTPIGQTAIILETEDGDVDLMGLPDGSPNWYVLGLGLWNLDGHTTAVLQQVGGTNVPLLKHGDAFRVEIGGYMVWRGRVGPFVPVFSELGWTHQYTCYSAEWWASLVPVTNPFTQTGRITFNAQNREDPEYVADLVGLTAGQIARKMLEFHASAFAAEGVTGFVPDDFATMEVVPPQAISFAGQNAFIQVRDFVAQWAGDHAFTVTKDGIVRAKKWDDFTRLPYDMTADCWAAKPSLSRDLSDVRTAVRVRGGAKVQYTVALRSKGDLQEQWTGTEEAGWKYIDFGGGIASVDAGQVTASTFLTVTVHSDIAGMKWAANELRDRHGTISVRRSLGTGIDDFRSRKIIANTALAPGGTSVLTLDFPLPVDTGWVDYRLSAEGGGSDVYRLYKVTNPTVGRHLVPYSAQPVAMSTASGTTSLASSIPKAWVVYQSIEFPLDVDILPSTEEIRVKLPVVYPLNTLPRLRQGNPGLLEPDDVQAGLFFATDVLDVREPETGFEGTGYTEDGQAREYVYDIPEWTYEGDAEQYRKLARMLLESMKDTIREGGVPYNSVREDILAQGPFVNMDVYATGPGGYTTGWENARMAVRAPRLSWEEGSGSPLRMDMEVSNRRRFATAPQAFLGSTITAVAGGASGGLFNPAFTAWGGQDVSMAMPGMPSGITDAAGNMFGMGEHMGNVVKADPFAFASQFAGKHPALTASMMHKGTGWGSPTPEVHAPRPGEEGPTGASSQSWTEAGGFDLPDLPENVWAGPTSQAPRWTAPPGTGPQGSIGTGGIRTSVPPPMELPEPPPPPPGPPMGPIGPREEPLPEGDIPPPGWRPPPFAE